MGAIDNFIPAAPVWALQGDLNRALVGTRFAGKLRHFGSIDSTNTRLLADAAGEVAGEGSVYVADEQTAGRGRGGHTWHSDGSGSPDAGGHPGLYVSALVRLPLPLREALWISLATGLAAQAAIRETTGIEADIRWPNDLLVGERKCGGILVETVLAADTLRHAVIGVGINLNQLTFPPDLAEIATSLRREAGLTISREAVVIALLRTLDLELTRLEEGRADLLQRFAEASTWVRGKRVVVAEAGGYTGVTDGLDRNGFLRVQADDGTQRTVLSGGVRGA